MHYAGARYYMGALGRWTSTDPILRRQTPGQLLKDGKVQAFSMSAYNYSFNNPVNLKDETGAWPTPDTILDLAFVAYSAYDVASTALSGDEVSGTQWAALGADAASLAIPGATGGGMAVRSAARGDDLVRALRTGDVAVDAVKMGEYSREAAVRSLQETAMAKPSVADEGLQNAVNALFKDSDNLPGGTPGALQYTAMTGELVGGSDHLQKALNRISQIEKRIESGDLNKSDLETAENLDQVPNVV